jgi:hypothetical protein
VTKHTKRFLTCTGRSRVSSFVNFSIQFRCSHPLSREFVKFEILSINSSCPYGRLSTEATRSFFTTDGMKAAILMILFAPKDLFTNPHDPSLLFFRSPRMVYAMSSADKELLSVPAFKTSVSRVFGNDEVASVWTKGRALDSRLRGNDAPENPISNPQSAIKNPPSRFFNTESRTLAFRSPRGEVRLAKRSFS